MIDCLTDAFFGKSFTLAQAGTLFAFGYKQDPTEAMKDSVKTFFSERGGRPEGTTSSVYIKASIGPTTGALSSGEGR